MKLLFLTHSFSYPPTKGYEVMLLKLLENLFSSEIFNEKVSNWYNKKISSEEFK